jgi:hypothetical protein
MDRIIRIVNYSLVINAMEVRRVIVNDIQPIICVGCWKSIRRCAWIPLFPYTVMGVKYNAKYCLYCTQANHSLRIYCIDNCLIKHLKDTHNTDSFVDYERYDDVEQFGLESW